MPTIYMLYVSSITFSGERPCGVDTVECTDWSCGTQAKTSQVLGLLWLLWRYEKTAGGLFQSFSQFLLYLNGGSFAEHLQDMIAADI